MDYKKTWRRKAREYLAAAFGGACTVCGYDKTISALDYHHLNALEKNAMLSVAMRNGHSWTKIVKEARKCTIVCCRCHREIHAGVTKLPKNYATFNEEYVDVIKLKKAKFDKCVCGNEKNKRQKYCSTRCSYQGQKKFEISKKELKKLVNEKPFTEIAKMFNVSDVAIRKRCKKFGILPVNRRGFWAKKRVELV